ncbi:S9 family peptidase [Sphingomonas sp. AAP5]|uniref:alpha/beta hydrolase family protein n=1 Tax=unclassified Sphingomonas TaxID=196159 RepID=UPI0010571F8A|nr:alpha/beta fold hydrolase [Sphingomonas sp. AAP5]QBM77108.1 S9 family peptidase [Sphingomonas sp. AAP5]
MTRHMLRAALIACVATSPLAASAAPDAAATAPTALTDAQRFGARESVQQISLSPDGKRAVVLMSAGDRGVAAFVLTVDSAEPLVRVFGSSGEKEQLDYCQWATNDRLVCGLRFTDGKVSDMVGFDRLITVQADGKNLKLLSARTSTDALGVMQNGGRIIDWQGDPSGATLLMTRQVVPEYSTGTHLNETDHGLAVERVDPATLRRSFVEPARADTEEYISDGRGTVRIAGIRPKTSSGYGATHIRYVYRKAGTTKWLPLSTVTGDAQTESGFDPYAVDPALDVVYGFDNLDGRRALFKIALDGSLKRELVYSRPDVDVAGLVRIGRHNRVVGVSFVTDRRQTDFFDPELKKLSLSLSKAMPGTPLVRFIDASADESKLLLWTGSDVDPGKYMVFDKKTRHLDALLLARPPLEEAKLAPVKAITFPAADGTPIPAYLTLPVGGSGKGLPAIVMPHGGPGDRDEWGFDWLVQFLAARGYAVLQPNYRGSTGYGDTWFQQNGFKSWRIAIGDVNDAGRWMVKQGIAAPGGLAIVGWSYGGYAALQSPILDPALFKAIVAIAPVTDLDTWRHEHDHYESFALVDAFVGKGPHIREGSPALNAAQIAAPVLLFHGDMDQNVGIGESRTMASRLRSAHKQVELVEFKGLDHQLDDTAARTKMLDKTDTFLRTSLGIK